MSEIATLWEYILMAGAIDIKKAHFQNISFEM